MVRLNRKLVLEDAQTVPDGAGGFEETWVPLGALWAHVNAGTGRETAAEFVTLSTVPSRSASLTSACSALVRKRESSPRRMGKGPRRSWKVS